MGTLFIGLVMLLTALPGAIWFARDASVARLNPWIWALWGHLSIVTPAVFCVALMRVLGSWALLPEKGSSGAAVIGLIPLAIGWLTAVLIHKRVLKTRREETIGTSLNYIGGWLAMLICALLVSALGSLVFYGLSVRNQIEYYCRDEQTSQSLVSCSRTFTPEIWGTVLTRVSVIFCVAGSLFAAFALCHKYSYAVRMTGYLLLGFVFIGFVDYHVDFLERFFPSAQLSHWGPLQEQIRSILTPNAAASIVWLVYLIKSKRVQEVYGRDFGS